MVVLSRVYGSRQFASLTTYDLAFVFALGSVELHQQLRLAGKGSLDGVRAVVLERNGAFSMLTDSEPATHEVYVGVVGADAVIDRRG